VTGQKTNNAIVEQFTMTLNEPLSLKFVGVEAVRLVTVFFSFYSLKKIPPLPPLKCGRPLTHTAESPAPKVGTAATTAMASTNPPS